MKRYSSHHYFRTDGTLGRFPVIEIDTDGRISGIEEHPEGLTETCELRFYSGVIIPRIKQQAQVLVFNSKSEFCAQIAAFKTTDIAIGRIADFVLLTGFDQTTFISSPGQRIVEIID